MKNFLYSGRMIFLDMASTILFAVLYTTTKSLLLSVALGMALGLAQIGWEIVRRRPIDTLQWVSLVLVMASGTATLMTHDVRFMIAKLSVVYVLIGAVMMKRGWMDRYLPPEAHDLVYDVAVKFGFVWAGLMFFTAVLNLALAFTCSVAEWAALISAWGTLSKLGLFGVQFATMRLIGGRRFRARLGGMAPA
jgi:intracellular septation protein A